ncbi:hypothetical protein [Nocardioides gansuensis]|uniref:hypothetical protein n=1 Tax=Nocardioides gansuensis TaxID=2138300 RepID=UPI001058261F|nr:hypothetical protein [Nocardioides gansuensis]
MPRTHGRPGEKHRTDASVMFQLTRTGVAVTVTVAPLRLVEAESGFHWDSGIHNQVSSPTYVMSGGLGAICVSGFASGIVPATWAASGPGSTHVIAGPSIQTGGRDPIYGGGGVHQYQSPSSSFVPAGGGC